MTNPRLKGLIGKPRKLELQRIRRERNLAAGLRHDGAPRVNNRYSVTPKERERLRMRIYRVRLYQRGLTASGTKRKRPHSHFPVTHFGFTGLSERELAYKKFREESQLSVS